MDENYLTNEALESIENILFDDMEENRCKLYIVSYDAVFSGTETGIVRKEHYNLFVFSEKEDAVKYMRVANRLIVTPYLATGKFKKILEETSDTMLPETEGSNIVYKICTKLLGIGDGKKNQSRFYSFKVEEVNSKLDII